MGRRAQWVIAWEKNHNITMKQAMVAKIATGASMTEICFEFTTTARAVRVYCLMHKITVPSTTMMLSDAERDRRARQAVQNLGYDPDKQKTLECDGEVKTRNQWYREYGGSSVRYYNGSDDEARAYIRERQRLKASGVDVKARIGLNNSNAHQRAAILAALPYVREAVQGLSETEIRVRIRESLAVITNAKGAAHEQQQNPPD